MSYSDNRSSLEKAREIIEKNFPNDMKIQYVSGEDFLIIRRDENDRFGFLSTIKEILANNEITARLRIPSDEGKKTIQVSRIRTTLGAIEISDENKRKMYIFLKPRHRRFYGVQNEIDIINGINSFIVDGDPINLQFKSNIAESPLMFYNIVEATRIGGDNIKGDILLTDILGGTKKLSIKQTNFGYYSGMDSFTNLTNIIKNLPKDKISYDEIRRKISRPFAISATSSEINYGVFRGGGGVDGVLISDFNTSNFTAKLNMVEPDDIIVVCDHVITNQNQLIGDLSPVVYIRNDSTHMHGIRATLSPVRTPGSNMIVLERKQFPPGTFMSM